MDIEHRAVSEVRTTGRTLFGVAAPFNRPADIGGLFSETILPGAFTATLAKRTDVLALSNHRSDQLLGRVRSGSLRLSETPAGLEYSLDLPATSLGNDVLALAQRGDLGGVSIGFIAKDEAWPSRDRRELRAVELHDVSVISGHAAYGDGTTIAVRSRERADALQGLRLFLAFEGI